MGSGAVQRTTGEQETSRARVRRIVRALVPWEVAVSLSALTLIWHFASLQVDNEILLPPPRMVVVAWWNIWTTDLAGDILASLRHLAIGYTIGVGTGFLLALLAVSFHSFEAVSDPIVEMLRPISGIAWIPIAIMMFGISELVPIFLIFYASLFPVFINTVAGIRAVDKQLLNAAVSLGASSRLVLTHVVVPGALPMILAGARLSLGVAWMVLVAAELVGGDSGLGWRSFWYEQFFAMNKVLAVILTIGVLGYLLDAMVRILQAWLTRWSPSAQVEG